MEETREWATLSPQEFAQLQKYMDYSSRRVQDVLQQFYGTGALEQHQGGEVRLQRGGPYARAAAGTPPTRLCPPLSAWISPGSGSSCARTWSWTLRSRSAGASSPPSRAGGGSPRSCLGGVSPRCPPTVTFKLYDKDGNGLLDSSEVERIITQMMRVAQYLDWDVTELEPILQEMMREIDYDGSGTVSLRSGG
uniref:EF-hand domain-containing protein n=1 Tax=Amazona collaria TaxID=241587 RepID=A0A8B9FWX0_9PSIT